MINLTEALIFGLSAWRCAHFVAEDDLPEPVRNWVDAKLRPEKLALFLSALIACVYCVTFWTSIISYNAQGYLIWFVNITAIWGAATYLALFHNLAVKIYETLGSPASEDE